MDKKFIVILLLLLNIMIVTSSDTSTTTTHTTTTTAMYEIQTTSSTINHITTTTVLPGSNHDFELRVEGQGLFTIGKREIIQIYIKNNADAVGSYKVYVTEIHATYNLNDASQLINVNINSDRINGVSKGETKTTIATLTVLGPVNEGLIKFEACLLDQYNRCSDTTSKYDYSLNTIRASYPISLSEFGLICFIVLLLISGFIYFKKIRF